MKPWIVIGGLVAIVAVTVSLLESCSDVDYFPRPHTTPLAFEVPAGFPPPVYNFQKNPLTQEGVELGRHLFYEGRLSIDGNFPCSSCHQQVASFTTYEHDRSHGYNHSHTLRNAPALLNLAWQRAFRQDGSAKTMEEVSYAHITAPDEMAESILGIIRKLQQDANYKQLFKAAYGDEQITGDRVLKALTQFMLTIVTADSKYDRVKKGTASFTSQEANGYQVFQAKCTGCHTEPLFTDFTYRNIGLPIQDFLSDFGRQRVTHQSSDSLKFRVPSLRNAELTSYYIHDGRSATLRNMVDHYRSRVEQGPTLDPSLKNGIPLTNTELDNVVAFLRTLSDSSILHNPKFGAP
ncbi:cytochrome-c peroxidase [Flavisolibacter tropicus]|uniref:Cytochrome C peroxidase n=1 Tax=Flavisolibacter tropicus TaxID=1492898 RepID=A0A172U004_9BACT|nr:cytochrome c peroxidase [Flavisolibacter tropicus]ANE52528.1 cytochrome C peroxidase [Flavisolibacter tropicus]